jgi:hypothetical protein
MTKWEQLQAEGHNALAHKYNDISSCDKCQPSPCLEPSGTTGPADAPTTLDALKRLRNEIGAILGMAESELREVVGHTNIAVLKQRIREADELLTLPLVLSGPADAGSHETLRTAILREVHAALCGCPIVVIDREKHPHGDLLGMRRSDAAKVLAALEAASASAPAVPREVGGAAPTSPPLDALLAEMDKILSATPNPTTEPFTAGFNVATYQWAEHLRIIMAASPASALVAPRKENT